MIEKLLKDGDLNGANCSNCCGDRIKILEWFKSKVVGGKLELRGDVAPVMVSRDK